MRIRILSDLHLEFEGFLPSAVDADVVVLADEPVIGFSERMVVDVVSDCGR